MVSLSQFLSLSLTLPVDALHRPSVLDLSDPPLPSPWLQNKPNPFGLFPINRSPRLPVIPAPPCAVPVEDQPLPLSPRRAELWHKILTPLLSVQLTGSPRCQTDVWGWPGLSPSAVSLQGWSTRARGGCRLHGLKDSVALPCLQVQLHPHSGHPTGEQRNPLMSQIRANKFMTAVCCLFTGDGCHIFWLFRVGSRV